VFFRDYWGNPLYSEQEAYGKALPLYERMWVIMEKSLGTSAREKVEILNTLARLYSANQEYGTAEKRYERALAICEEALGKEHPDTQFIASRLADLREKLAAPPKP
jgi:tetratricopeptide (TPR) repeat protein